VPLFLLLCRLRHVAKRYGIKNARTAQRISKSSPPTRDASPAHHGIAQRRPEKRYYLAFTFRSLSTIHRQNMGAFQKADIDTPADFSDTKNEAHNHLELVTGLWRFININLKKRMKRSYQDHPACATARHG